MPPSPDLMTRSTALNRSCSPIARSNISIAIPRAETSSKLAIEASFWLPASRTAGPAQDITMQTDISSLPDLSGVSTRSCIWSPDSGLHVLALRFLLHRCSFHPVAHAKPLDAAAYDS